MIPVFPGRYDRVSGYRPRAGYSRSGHGPTTPTDRECGWSGTAHRLVPHTRHMDSRDRSPRQMKRPGRTPVWLYVVLAVVAVVAVVLVMVALATR